MDLAPRKISSRFAITPWYVIVVVVAACAAFLYFMYDGSPLWWFFLVGHVFAFSLATYLTRPLKHVAFDGQSLHISNGRRTKKIVVPLSEVADVRANWAFKWIVVNFKAPTEFGSRIAFVPTFRWLTPIVPHPDFVELNNAVVRSRVPQSAGSSSK